MNKSYNIVYIFILLCLLLLSQHFSYAQLNTPSANMKVENMVSYDVLEKIAVTKAQQLWGQVALGQPIPCCDDNGDIVVYMFPFKIGSATFPGYDEILKGIQEGRTEYQEITKRLQEEKMDIFDRYPIDKQDDLPRRDESNFDLNRSMTGAPELLMADMSISRTEELSSALTMAKYKKYGINEYGTIYISIRADRFPIPLRSHYLCPYYSMGDLALQKAQEVLGTTNIRLEHYYFLGLGRGQYFEFSSGKKRILIEAYLLQPENPEKILNRKGQKIEPLPRIMTEIKDNWEEIVVEGSLADHTVDYPDLVPDIDWCRGCTPTSASMAIGYWDNYANSMTYGGFGRLIDYWRELSYLSDGTGPLRNVPNILDELRLAMNTDVNGITSTGDISSGIESVCNTTNGYNFDSDEHHNESDWNWSVIKNEIDDNRPFVWSVGLEDSVGHSLCAWGYTDGKDVITYSTWGRGRDDWYYNQYDNGQAIDWSYVHTVEPGGSQDPHTMVIDDPDGGETLDVGSVFPIWWHQWGTLIQNVDLSYSTNGGASWTTIISNVASSEGWNSLNWTVPFSLTNRGRVRITAWDASNNYISGDGSFENFRIADTTPPTAPGTPSDEGDWTSSTIVKFIWTPAIDNGSGVVDYQLQVGTFCCDNSVFDGWIGNVLEYSVTGTRGQTLYAKVRAKDGVGLVGVWSQCSDGILINTPPVASNLKITPELCPKTTDDLVGSYDYFDADGDPQGSSQIRWYKDGLPQWALNDILTVPSSATVKHQSWKFSVKPHDGKEFGALVYSDSVMICNTPPVVSDLLITPVEPDCDDDLVLSYTYFDADGDPDSCTRIHWYRHGIHQPAFDDLLTIPGSATTCCDRWYATVEPNDGEEFGAMQTSPTVNVQMQLVIEAEAMQGQIPYYGKACTGGWNLTHPNHPLFEDVDFPQDFQFHFIVTAKAEIGHGIAPWLEVKIGDEFVGTCEINSTTWQDYAFVASITGGIHTLSLNYLNDWWVPSVGDRNLLIDNVEISCQFDPPTDNIFTFEAEDMGHQHPKNYEQSGNVVLHRPYSYVAHDLYLTKDALTLEVIASAVPTDGVWPEMNIRFDDVVVLSLIVPSSSSMKYQMHFSTSTALAGITDGIHCIKIEYKHESWASGRHILIDKMSLHTDAGLLKASDETPPAAAPTVKLPANFALKQNYPNPFNPDTDIDYELPVDCFVKIRIMNVLGQEIRALTDTHQSAGYHTVHWDGKDDRAQQVGSGVYFYSIDTGEFYSIRKMILLR